MATANGVSYARYRGIVRALRLMRAVAGRRSVNVEALANQFRVCSRTIRRDLQALSAAGVVVPRCWTKGDGDMAL